MAMTLNTEEQNRVNNVYNEREKALAENNSIYGGLIDQAGALRNEQNAFLAQQEQTQNNILDKQLEHQTNLINQQKEEAAANKRVEENKAMNDFTAYTNPYGLTNERLFAEGLGRSGVSETAKLGGYSAYNNRVAAANTAYVKAVQEYDNDINAARLNNDVQKAQNALNKLQLQLQNNQDYYSNVSSLSQNKLNNSQKITSMYLDQYNNVYNQILNEQKQAEAVRQYNANLAEEIRQYNEKMAYQRERDAIADAQWQKEFALAQAKAASSGGRSSGGSSKKSSSSLSGNSLSGNQYTDTTELYQTKTPLLSGADKDWYNNHFNKHSYQKKDLDWVLANAPISASAKMKIYDSYGVK